VAVIVGSGGLVASGVNLVRVAIDVGVLNALLLPIVLAILFRLARNELPDTLRLRGGYAVAVGLTFGAVSVLGLYASAAGVL
jgi:hypothetical protein